MKRRTGRLSLGALVVLVLLVRETGVLQLSAYWSKRTSTCRTTWHGESAPTQRGGLGHVRWRDDGAGVIGVNGGGPDGSFTCTTLLTRFELDGPCWVPLRKSGTASFAAELRTADGRLIAEFDGELSQTVTGPCSLHEFRSLLRDEALDYIERAIDDHL